MNRIHLSETEKALLLSLGRTRRLNKADLSSFSDEALYVAGKRFEEAGFIHAIFSNGRLYDATIISAGTAYLEENPNLESSISDDIGVLTKQNLTLQNSELEYQVTIRKQKDIIRAWQIATAILGFISLLLFARTVILSFFYD